MCPRGSTRELTLGAANPILDRRVDLFLYGAIARPTGCHSAIVPFAPCCYNSSMGTVPNLPSLDWVLRLGTAMLCGALLGVNRDLHHKPAGLRTFSLVSLAAATVILTTLDLSRGDMNAVSRVAQGMLTGIGFLGAGIILHRDAQHVIGLTTAAAVWLAAALGVTCGFGLVWQALAVTAAGLLIMIVGGPIEQWLTRFFRGRIDPEDR